MFWEWKESKPTPFTLFTGLKSFRELMRNEIVSYNSSKISGRKNRLHHHGMKAKITITKIKYAYVKTKTAQKYAKTK